MKKNYILTNKFKKRDSEKGITLLEAIVSTAIIGIGFVAVFQMVQYSVRSIDISGERTKANYVVGTIAEDIFAYKQQEKASKNFMDSLKDTPWKAETCAAGSNSNPTANIAEATACSVTSISSCLRPCSLIWRGMRCSKAIAFFSSSV